MLKFKYNIMTGLTYYLEPINYNFKSKRRRNTQFKHR